MPDPDGTLALAEGVNHAIATRAGVTRPLCSEMLTVLPGVPRGAIRQPPAWVSLAGYGAITARGIVVAWGRGER